MDHIKGISVLLYTRCPDRLPQCIYSISSQKDVDIDINIIVQSNSQDLVKDKLQESFCQKIFPFRDEAAHNKTFYEAVAACKYDNILFVSDDSVFEGDLFARLLDSLGEADGLIFNMDTVAPSLKEHRLYPLNKKNNNMFIQDPEADGPLTFRQVYAKSPNVWNHVFKKHILLKSPIYLKNVIDQWPYYFVACYHSRCQAVACDTDLFVYRLEQEKTNPPILRMRITQFMEIRRMLNVAKKRLPKNAADLLKKDFSVSFGKVSRYLRWKMRKDSK